MGLPLSAVAKQILAQREGGRGRERKREGGRRKEKEKEMRQRQRERERALRELSKKRETE